MTVRAPLYVVPDDPDPATEPSDHSMPVDLDAEQAVFGAAMLSAAAPAEMRTLIDGTDFYRPAHETIWQAVCASPGCARAKHWTCARTTASYLNRVEVLRRYSQPSMLYDLRMVMKVISADPTQGVSEPVSPASRVSTAEPHCLTSRLTDETITALVYMYRSGATAKKVAEQYGISMSSVKRLLRRAGGRLKDEADGKS